MPLPTNKTRAPPTGLWRLALTSLALTGTVLRQLGKPGAALERWALRRLGVWPTTTDD
jgi:hypothetical protein